MLSFYEGFGTSSSVPGYSWKNVTTVDEDDEVGYLGIREDRKGRV